MATDWTRQWEHAMTQWWDTVLDDPATAKGMGASLAANARMRGQWEKGMDRTMESMHLPTRNDVIRVARIASLLEDRLVALEDQVLEQGDQLGRIEKETLKARVDAAEALVTVQERLERIEAKIDALAAAAVPTPKRTRSRAKKTTEG